MKKEVCRQIISWFTCLALGFLIINILSFAYKRQSWWLDTPNGASMAVKEPFSVFVNATEGFSVSMMDRNGYSNPNKELADDYILMMGASHSVGKEVLPEKKYSVLVNEHIAHDNYLHTYNISMEGHFLPSQIKHFKAAIDAFDKSSAVTIEIVGTDYSIEELKDAVYNQVSFDENDTVKGFYRLPLLKQISKTGRTYLPLYSIIKSNLDTMKEAKVEEKAYQVDLNDYTEIINDAMALLRSEYNNPIVFIYHPKLNIEEDGTISLVYSKTWDIFKEACRNNNVDIIDTGEDFLRCYEQEHKLPYGFSNTTLGDGHLNEKGHEILAEEIIEYLDEL